MRRLMSAAVVAVGVLLMPSRLLAFEIPDFTPNVVDPDDYLQPAGEESVNAELQRIRDESGIWGAVLIVDTLDGEPIEAVAVQAFEQWQLGQRGVDNGLLLVLAMEDRRSRFEVGYGLEGSITDVAALHALDDYLAPGLRAGDIPGAVVAGFAFLSRLVAQDPDALHELEEGSDDELHWRRGFVAWGVMMFCLWLGWPIRARWLAHRRRRLQTQNAGLSLADEQVATDHKSTTNSLRNGVALKLFLSLNPGAFVLVFSALNGFVYMALMVLMPLVLFLLIWVPGRRYQSLARYQEHLDRVARRRRELIRIGHLEEKSPGVYNYTPAYHASRRSSSGSGSRSSSGGGRSGGGGASSSW